MQCFCTSPECLSLSLSLCTKQSNVPTLRCSAAPSGPLIKTLIEAVSCFSCCINLRSRAFDLNTRSWLMPLNCNGQTALLSLRARHASLILVRRYISVRNVFLVFQAYMYDVSLRNARTQKYPLQRLQHPKLMTIPPRILPLIIFSRAALILMPRATRLLLALLHGQHRSSNRVSLAAASCYVGNGTGG